MELLVLHDKSMIAGFFNRNPGLHLMAIGDLDDFFFPKTCWFALTDRNVIQTTALLYVGMATPTLLLFHEGDPGYAIQLLEKIKTILPAKFNAHLSPGLFDVFGKQNLVEYYGLHYKMALKKVVDKHDDTNIRRLTEADLPVIKDFYTVSYPQNWFDSRMLETTKYFGYFINNKLVGISGIHVYSEPYGIAALGNIATHPDYRGQQIGYKVTSVLCHDLQKSIKLIGLNVKTSNEHAIKCYSKIGFEIIGTFDECCIKNG